MIEGYRIPKGTVVVYSRDFADGRSDQWMTVTKRTLRIEADKLIARHPASGQCCFRRGHHLVLWVNEQFVKDDRRFFAGCVEKYDYHQRYNDLFRYPSRQALDPVWNVAKDYVINT